MKIAENKSLILLEEIIASFHDLPLINPDYHYLAEQILKVSKAEVVSVQSYNEITNRFKTEVIAVTSKAQEKVEVGLGIIGFNPVGRKWLTGPGFLFKKPYSIRPIEGVYQLTYRQIPKEVCQQLEKTMDLGPIYKLDLQQGGNIFGNLVFFFSRGQDLKNGKLLQIIARHIEGTLWQKKIEKELLESRECYRSLLEGLQEAVLVFSSEGRVVDFNNATCQMLGYSRREIMGMGIADLVLPGTDFEKTWRIKGNGGFISEVTFRTKDGREILTEIFLNTRGDGTLQGTIWDISEQKLMQYNAVTIQKAEILKALSGGIGHDFNNFLALLLSNVQLIQILYKEGKDVVNYFGLLLKSIEKASSLSKQLLTFSRGGVPTRELSFVPVLLREIVEFTLKGTNLKAVYLFPEDLWPVEVDRGQFSQVISNLVLNAVQASPKGGELAISGENVTISSAMELPLPAGRYVKIMIQDQGVGISRKDLSRVFDPFFTTKAKGSGLGLTTCFSIIKKHEGYINLDSQPQVGTKVSIYLPISKTVWSKKVEKPPTLLRGSGKLLLMDDDYSLREMLKEILEEIGYEVETTVDGRETIECFKKARDLGNPFDVVIVNLIVQGGMGGKETIEKLLWIAPEVKVILCSGYHYHPLMLNYKKYGFAGAINKPFRVESLHWLIEDLMVEH